MTNLGKSLTLTDRMLVRLSADPGVFDMVEFSVSRPGRKTFCLGGIILDESKIPLKYNERRIAVGLADGVAEPSKKWLEYERLLVMNAPHESLCVAAKAREIWAHEHGDYAAMNLPLYVTDWEGFTEGRELTAQDLIEYLVYVDAGVFEGDDLAAVA